MSNNGPSGGGNDAGRIAQVQSHLLHLATAGTENNGPVQHHASVPVSHPTPVDHSSLPVDVPSYTKVIAQPPPPGLENSPSTLLHTLNLHATAATQPSSGEVPSTVPTTVLPNVSSPSFSYPATPPMGGVVPSPALDFRQTATPSLHDVMARHHTFQHQVQQHQSQAQQWTPTTLQQQQQLHAAQLARLLQQQQAITQQQLQLQQQQQNGFAGLTPFNDMLMSPPQYPNFGAAPLGPPFAIPSPPMKPGVNLAPGTLIQSANWSYSVPYQKRLRGGGVSCHHCKMSKEPAQLVFCTNQAKEHSKHRLLCKKKVCHACLKRVYPEFQVGKARELYQAEKLQKAKAASRVSESARDTSTTSTVTSNASEAASSPPLATSSTEQSAAVGEFNSPITTVSASLSIAGVISPTDPTAIRILSPPNQPSSSTMDTAAEAAAFAAELARWICPSCRDVCVCAICVNEREQRRREEKKKKAAEAAVTSTVTTGTKVAAAPTVVLVTPSPVATAPTPTSESTDAGVRLPVTPSVSDVPRTSGSSESSLHSSPFGSPTMHYGATLHSANSSTPSSLVDTPLQRSPQIGTANAKKRSRQSSRASTELQFSPPAGMSLSVQQHTRTLTSSSGPQAPKSTPMPPRARTTPNTPQTAFRDLVAPNAQPARPSQHAMDEWQIQQQQHQMSSWLQAQQSHHSHQLYSLQQQQQSLIAAASSPALASTMPAGNHFVPQQLPMAPVQATSPLLPYRDSISSLGRLISGSSAATTTTSTQSRRTSCSGLNESSSLEASPLTGTSGSMHDAEYHQRIEMMRRMQLQPQQHVGLAPHQPALAPFNAHDSMPVVPDAHFRPSRLGAPLQTIHSAEQSRCGSSMDMYPQPPHAQPPAVSYPHPSYYPSLQPAFGNSEFAPGLSGVPDYSRPPSVSAGFHDPDMSNKRTRLDEPVPTAPHPPASAPQHTRRLTPPDVSMEQPTDEVIESIPPLASSTRTAGNAAATMPDFHAMTRELTQKLQDLQQARALATAGGMPPPLLPSHGLNATGGDPILSASSVQRATHQLNAGLQDLNLLMTRNEMELEELKLLQQLEILSTIKRLVEQNERTGVPIAPATLPSAAGPSLDPMDILPATMPAEHRSQPLGSLPYPPAIPHYDSPTWPPPLDQSGEPSSTHFPTPLP